MSASVATRIVTDETALSLARIGAAIDGLRVGLAAFGAERGLLFYNPRFVELFGLPANRLTTGMSFAAMLHMMETTEEYAGDPELSFIAAQRSADRRLRHETRRNCGDGRVIDILSDPTPGGGWTITVNDISALAQAEGELRRRAGLLHSILENIPHGICVYGPDQRLTMINQAYHRIMRGAPLVVGDHLEDIIRRRALAGEYGPGDVATIIATELAHDVTRLQARRRVRPNGIAMDVRTAPLPDGGYISVVTDISALVEAENEANLRAETMLIMLTSMRHGILLWGADNRLIASNELAAEMLGHGPGVLVAGISRRELSAHAVTLGTNGSPEVATALVDTLRQRDHSVSNRRFLTTRSGRILEAVSDPIAGGGVVSTFTDVTAARETEAELRRAKAQAEIANQAKSRFLATMSHELRTPLNTVIGFSDALKREAGGAAVATIAGIGEFADAINAAGHQLLRQINAILDVARLESGRFDLQTEPVDLAVLCETCLRQVHASAEAAEISLDLALPEPVPMLSGDPQRMAQVLGHLLSNALKFTAPGGKVTVSVEIGEALLIRVSDTGIGIADADLQRVFEPFLQLDASLSRRFQGAGLGLYISRALIEAQDGTLVLVSRPGNGTMAEIRMPRERLLPTERSGQGLPSS